MDSIPRLTLFESNMKGRLIIQKLADKLLMEGVNPSKNWEINEKLLEEVFPTPLPAPGGITINVDLTLLLNAVRSEPHWRRNALCMVRFHFANRRFRGWVVATFGVHSDKLSISFTPTPVQNWLNNVATQWKPARFLIPTVRRIAEFPSRSILLPISGWSRVK